MDVGSDWRKRRQVRAQHGVHIHDVVVDTKNVQIAAYRMIPMHACGPGFRRLGSISLESIYWPMVLFLHDGPSKYKIGVNKTIVQQSMKRLGC